MRVRVKRFYIDEDRLGFELRVGGFVIPGNLRGLGRRC